MIVVRVADGDLFLHSPLKFNAELAQQLSSTATVRHLVSPSSSTMPISESGPARFQSDHPGLPACTPACTRSWHRTTCFSCHDPHGTDNVSLLRANGNSLCLGCHAPNAQIGPFASSIEAHSHHKANSAGSQCVSCHMPQIEETLGDVKVHAHTFRFITPAETEALKIPNACNLCHADKTTAWAEEVLKSWTNRSPWRMEQ